MVPKVSYTHTWMLPITLHGILISMLCTFSVFSNILLSLRRQHLHRNAASYAVDVIRVTLRFFCLFKRSSLQFRMFWFKSFDTSWYAICVVFCGICIRREILFTFNHVFSWWSINSLKIQWKRFRFIESTPELSPWLFRTSNLHANTNSNIWLCRNIFQV